MLNESFEKTLKPFASEKIKVFSALIAEFDLDQNRSLFCENVVNYLRLLETANDYYEFFNENKFNFLLPPGKSKNAEAQSKLKFEIERLRDGIKEANFIFSVDKLEEDKNINNSFETVKDLFELTKKYEAYYKKAKREENALDFNDLEVLALELLQNEEVAEKIKKRYDFVFVDEYQDVNGVQEKLIDAVSLDNAFLVGDAKQSIYAFRGCNPWYFENKYNSYKNGNGTAISLDYNFRSTKKIIDTVNEIFIPLMTKDFGGTDYSSNPMIYGGGYGEYLGESIIHVINSDDKKDKQEIERGVYSVMNTTEKLGDKETDDEVKLIVKLISETLNKPYYDIREKDPSKRYKKIGFGDIAILLRSIGSGSRLAEEITSTLISLSVPVASSVKKSIKDYPEVKAMINLVSLLNSAERDVPVASVMLNFFNFTENELAIIKKEFVLDKSESFFALVQKYSSLDNSIAKKCKDFIAWLEDKRLIAEFLPAETLLKDIVLETGFLSKITASKFGEIKASRIERLISECSSLGESATIFELESHLNDVLDDITVSEFSGDDTVKIMTMHASKGLEYPVVILAGLSKRFNESDRIGNVISLRNYGVSVKSFFEEDMTCSENAVRYLFKHEIKKNLAIEELRLLYVALTRAKCNLHVIVKGKQINRADSLKNFTSMSDFISTVNTSVINYDEVDGLIDGFTDGSVVAGGITSRDISSEIINNFSYKYPYQNETTLPLKSSVTSASDNFSDEYYETTALFGDSSKEEGTAYHRFLELIDFYNYNGEKDANNFLSANLMSEEQISAIDFNKVKKLLNLQIFEEIKGYEIYKERKFCVLVPACEILSTDSKREILVQGMIDLLAVKDDEAIIVDYKLSTIKNPLDLVNKYKKQIELYKNAVERTLKLKVKKCCLVNLLQETEILV